MLKGSQIGFSSLQLRTSTILKKLRMTDKRTSSKNSEMQPGSIVFFMWFLPSQVLHARSYRTAPAQHSSGFKIFKNIHVEQKGLSNQNLQSSGVSTRINKASSTEKPFRTWNGHFQSTKLPPPTLCTPSSSLVQGGWWLSEDIPWCLVAPTGIRRKPLGTMCSTYYIESLQQVGKIEEIQIQT